MLLFQLTQKKEVGHMKVQEKRKKSWTHEGPKREREIKNEKKVREGE
jgi:hypothetical protein